MKKGYAKDDSKKSKKSIKKGYAKGDIGKKNVPGKTGFAAVAGKAAKEYGSKQAGARVAGAVLKKMRASGKV